MPGEEFKKNGVIYCVMGTEVGSNKKRHASIVLIRDGMVSDTLGYYGAPDTARHPLIRFLKKKFNIVYDMRENHGLFEREAFHVFDKGYRMYGKFFPLSHDKVELLQKKINSRLDDQNEAIEEVAKEFHLPAKAPDKMRKYPYEHHSKFIFKHEKSKSKQAGYPSRLRPFEVTPYNRKSNNCKVQALDLLEDILLPDEITMLAGWHRGIPLYSGGQLDWLFFKGEGNDWYAFQKKSGQTIFSRKPETSQIKWQPYVQDARSIDLIEQLIRIERLIEAPDCADPQNNEELLSYRHDFLNQIRCHYECFAHVKESGWSVLGLFSWEKTTLMGYRRDANHLLQVIYAAAIGEFDPYAIDKKDPADLAFVVVRELSVEKKKMLCEIMGRAYQQGVSIVSEYVNENPKMKMM